MIVSLAVCYKTVLSYSMYTQTSTNLPLLSLSAHLSLLHTLTMFLQLVTLKTMKKINVKSEITTQKQGYHKSKVITQARLTKMKDV